ILLNALMNMLHDANARGDEASAWRVAENLVSSDPAAPCPFFEDAAKELTAAAILAHSEAEPGPWRLGELVCAPRSETALQEILGKTARGRELLELYGDWRVFNDVLSTLIARTEHVARRLGV